MTVRTGALRLLLVIGTVATALGVAASPVAAAPALTLSTSTGVLDRQVVTVTGSGFTPGQQVVIAQCVGTALPGCTVDPPVNTTGAYATASPSGEVSATLRVERVLEVDGGYQPCLEQGCAIAAITRTNPATEIVRTPITFAPTGTAPPDTPGSLTATVPLPMRPAGGRAALAGSGFLTWFRTIGIDQGDFGLISTQEEYGPAGPGAYLALCSPAGGRLSGCRRFIGPETPLGQVPVNLTRPVAVRADGTVDAAVAVPRMWDTRDGRIDCAVEDCSLALEQDVVSTPADIDWAPEWAPYRSASAFVAAAYPALVGRAPTTSERATAIADLTARSVAGYTFLRRLAGRSDGRRLAEVACLYQAALGRRPDGNGLSYWASELRRTGSSSAVATAMARSPEFRQAFAPPVSDTGAVTRAYSLTLHRLPTADERAYWVGRLRAGLARSHMVHLFSRTPEFNAREAGRCETAAVTVGLLRRGPTEREWVDVGPEAPAPYDPRTRTQRADDGVLRILSSRQLTDEQDAA